MSKATFDPIFVLSLTVFALSLGFEAFSNGHEAVPGWACLALGWWGLVGGCYAWLANPLIVFSWVMRAAQQGVSMAAAALAVVFMFSFLGAETVVTNTAGMQDRITHVGIGYWLWLAGGILALGAALSGTPGDSSDQPQFREDV
jgi:hypothetical protein